jgi:hypothetical protein
MKLKIKEDEISEENRKNLSNPTSSLRANVEEQHSYVSTILKNRRPNMNRIKEDENEDDPDPKVI